jgi:hypothetical protein
LNLELCGTWELIVGMEAMEARVRVAMAEILPERLISWKKIMRLIRPMSQRGTKILIRVAPGVL